MSQSESGDDDGGTATWQIHHQRPQRKKKPSTFNTRHHASATESSSRRKIFSRNDAQQHILLLVGLPGSGKTTLANTLRQKLPWKYMTVNQDLLKSRPACLRETQRILDLGKCPIIDRCNISQAQRQYFTQFTTTVTTTKWNDNSGNDLRLNTQYVPVDCVVLKIASVKECIARCQQRTDHPTLPPDKVHRVIGIMQKEWEDPKAAATSTTTATTTGAATIFKSANPSSPDLRSVVTIRNEAELQKLIATIVNSAHANIDESGSTGENVNVKVDAVTAVEHESVTTTTTTTTTTTAVPLVVPMVDTATAAGTDAETITTCLETLPIVDDKR